MRPGWLIRKRLTRFIGLYSLRHGTAPTLRELCEAAGVSSRSTASYHLVRLEQDGRIVRTRHGRRAITLLPPTGRQLVMVRRCGSCRLDMPSDHVCEAPGD